MKFWEFNKVNHIELFAGCGGLSLGLKAAGFELVLANELSPMAAETFAYNLLNEDLSNLAVEEKKASKTLWLSSCFADLKSRLRENPFLYPELQSGKSDIPLDTKEIKGKLIVGSIVQLNQILDTNASFLSSLKHGFGDTAVDLISGGPPCQSFSLAGLRRKDCEKNTLPWEFANFVEHVQPKIAILENVTGILRSFKDSGTRYHAWFEVAKVFATKKYIPLCLHINAKQAGVAQSRPRFIMISLREDIYRDLSKTFNDSEKILFKSSICFYNKISKGQDPNFGELEYFDSKIEKNCILLRGSFLAPLVSSDQATVEHAIQDLLLHNPKVQSSYVGHVNNNFNKICSRHSNEIKNHEPRLNSQKVKSRFRIYQIIQECKNAKTKKEIVSILKGESSHLSADSWGELRNYSFFISDAIERKFDCISEVVEFIKMHRTKKQTQRALNPKSPAPTALSIPDDACHYSELRTLTVREMARIQSFPDDFEFRSKTTTGGQMRKFEVPQYTQVGNAVPPLLGMALGNSVKSLLQRLLD